MTQEQHKFIQGITTVDEAQDILARLTRDGNARSVMDFWSGLKQLKPDISEKLRVEKSKPPERVQEIGKSAWDAAKYNRVELPRERVQSGDDKGRTIPPEHEIADEIRRHFYKSRIKGQVRFVFDLLSDGKVHTRQELIDAIHEEGWGNDYEFRKHVSDVREELEAINSPYMIPKNNTDKRGYGLYQLRLKTKV